MARLNSLSDILFPVKEQPVFVCIKTGVGEQWASITDKKAIVNQNTGRVLGVVGRGYRLISNSEALELGYACCQAVFPETKKAEWGVATIDAPRSAGHCHIDLQHNTAALDFSLLAPRDRPEAFGPYIRVTNSYNTRRALAFNIGFQRKVCSNGLILPESIIRFSFPHSGKNIENAVQFAIARARLNQMKLSIESYMDALKQADLSGDLFASLLYAVLAIPRATPKKSEQPTEESLDLEAHIADLCTRYAGELGENAYAAFNAITDFASHPPQSRLVRRDRHSYQRRAGKWLADFAASAPAKPFDWEKYIDSLSKQADNHPGYRHGVN